MPSVNHWDHSGLGGEFVSSSNRFDADLNPVVDDSMVKHGNPLLKKCRREDEILDEPSLVKSSGESLKSGKLQKPLCIYSVSHLASGNGGMMLSRWSMSAFHKTSSWANCLTNNADLPSVESKWQAWFKDEQWEDPSRRGWLAASRSRRVINVASKLGKLEQSLP